jgi:hypothetical protein
MSAEPGPELPSDFAERVLHEVDRIRRWRRWGGAAAAGLVAAALLRLGSHAAPQARSPRGAALEADDLAWLEQAGAEPSDPEAMMLSMEIESTTSAEGNPLVAVAENL